MDLKQSRGWRRAARLVLLICVAGALMACSDDEEPPGVPGDAKAQTDGPVVDLSPFLDAAPDRLLLPDSLLDQKIKYDQGPLGDGGDPCASWANWYCQGTAPTYEAVCPPGLNPKRIIRCTLSQMCSCEVVGVSQEKDCFYMPQPNDAGSICSSFEKAFYKGCCKP